MGLLDRMRGVALAARSAYAAARQPAGRAPWVAPTGSARKATDGAIRTIADRARDAVRNNAYAARIVDLWVANAVGTGITTSWPSGSGEAAAWRAWVAGPECDAEGELDWPGLQALAFRAVVESGEGLVWMRPVPPTPDNPVGLTLQVLEGDRLDWQHTGMAGNGNRIVQGIELDARGRKVAYWMREDYDDFPLLRRADAKRIRVPAEDVIHLYRRRRPGQLRDVSWLAPILWQLKDLTEYESALLKKAFVEACLALVVTGDDEEAVTGDVLRDGRGQAVEAIEPQTIMYRRGGGSVETISPSGGGSHAGFARRQLEAASVGAGLTYDQVSGDLSQANYSSLRAGKIEFRRLLEQVQYTMLVPMLVQRVAKRFHAQGAMLGLFAPQMPAATHVPPAPEMVDPLKDTMALIAQVRAGFIAQDEAVAMFGRDFGEVMAKIAAANAAADEAGIILDTDARRVAKTGAAQDAAQNAAVEIAATGAASPRAGDEAARDAQVDRALVQVVLSDDMGAALRAELAPAMASAEAAAEAARAATAEQADALRAMRDTADDMALVLTDSRAALAGTAERVAAAADAVAAAAERAARPREVMVLRDADKRVTGAKYL
jgi:lambda family phage portal protein